VQTPSVAKRWVEALARYGAPEAKRGVVELIVTAMPFLLLWALMLHCLESYGYAVCLVLALPTAGFLMRLFLIQHDCGHGSFLPGRVGPMQSTTPRRAISIDAAWGT
jgi:acyl-lipid omega-6 desaturase (Delta-12 desaturase)